MLQGTNQYRAIIVHHTNVRTMTFVVGYHLNYTGGGYEGFLRLKFKCTVVIFDI